MPSVAQQQKDALKDDEFSRRDKIKQRLGLDVNPSAMKPGENDAFPTFEHDPATSEGNEDEMTSFDAQNGKNDMDNLVKRDTNQRIPKNYDASKLPGSDAPEWMKL